MIEKLPGPVKNEPFEDRLAALEKAVNEIIDFVNAVDADTAVDLDPEDGQEPDGD